MLFPSCRHVARAQACLRAQDDQLDDISLTVGRIGEVGRAMHDELTLQGRMLEELDTDLDGTSTRLKAAQRKVR